MSWQDVGPVTLMTIKCRQMALDNCRLEGSTIQLVYHEAKNGFVNPVRAPLTHESCSLIINTSLSNIGHMAPKRRISYPDPQIPP